MIPQNKKYEILNNTFGHKAFRAFQEGAVDAILSKQDLLTIIPTGAGKSLCYQLPALLLDGLTVVISPLIALMNDQVVALQANNIEASLINSSLNQEQIESVIQQIKNKEIKILYVAPERFQANGFLEFLSSIDISLFVIDEAHCVSEWGHEFRADYQKLSLLKQHFPTTPIAAFTATATKKVQQNIVSSLNLNNPLILRGETKRENLTITATKRVGNGHSQLIEFLKDKKNQTGIVYTFTRRETQSVVNFLIQNGFSAKAYHAGLSNEIREDVYKEFINDEINIVVATIAFGMGIDKSNIRFVVHTSMPKTIENYYQEIGRAGRDGLESKTLLLYTKADEISKMAMMDDITNLEYRKLLEEKLNFMYRFASSSNCRHKTIASYFGDEIDPCGSKCDNCTKEKVEQVDITIDSRKFLSTVFRANQSFGQNHLVDILRGSKNQKIYQFEHQKLSVYGIGEDKSKNEWDAIVDRLFDIDAISVGEYRAIKLTPYGLKVLKGEDQVFIDKDKMGVITHHNFILDTSDDEPEFFEELKALRTEISKKEQVPAYVVFSDKILVTLCQTLPTTKEEFLAIDGIGLAKWEKYGEIFVQLIAKIKDENNIQDNIIEIKQTQTLEIKKLTKTYLDTLELIEQNNTIEQIAKIKGVQNSTIVSHLKVLYQHQKLSQEQLQHLLNHIKEQFPTELKNSIESLLLNYDIKTLKSQLSLYEQLFI